MNMIHQIRDERRAPIGGRHGALTHHGDPICPCDHLKPIETITGDLKARESEHWTMNSGDIEFTKK